MKIFTLAFLFIANLSSTLASTDVKQNTSPPLEVISLDACKDQHVVTQEMLELELSGYRWQRGNSLCLKRTKFTTLYPMKNKVGDASLLDPEFVISRGRDVKIISEKLIHDEAVEVKIAYIGKKDGKDVPVQDQFTYIQNFGKNRATRGCGSILSEPEHFVMREECAKE